MTAILLIGGGGHCKAAIDVIETDGRFEIAGIIEREGVEVGDVLGYSLLGVDDDLASLVATIPAALVTIGQIKSAAPRKRAFERALAAGALLPIVCSPRAHISRHAQLGDGTLAMHGAVVNAAARVGRNCILNSLSLVEHDAQVGDHCHISTGARVNGGVVLGEGCFVGSGSVLKNGISIGAGSIIGAGCLVTKSLPTNSFVRRAA